MRPTSTSSRSSRTLLPTPAIWGTPTRCPGCSSWSCSSSPSWRSSLPSSGSITNRQGRSEGNAMEATVRRRVQAESFAEVLRRKSVRSVLWSSVVTLIVLVGSIMLLFPVAFMITTSLKTSGAVFLLPIKWIPGLQFVPQWKNFPTALDFMRWQVVYGNTLKITITDMVGDTLSAAVVAYGFARFRAPGRDVLFTLVLATLMIPYQVRLVPEFLGWSLLHLVNTLWPLIIPAWFGSAFNIFLLRQFFMTIPIEMDEEIGRA